MKTFTGSCLKLLVVTFSLTFLLISVLFFVFGFVIPNTGSDGFNPGLFIYGVGTITALIALLGTYGSLRENYTTLMTFVTIVAISLLMQLLALGLLVFHKNTITEVAIHEFQTLIHDYTTSTISRHYVDRVQMTFKCCGARGYDDWKDNKTGVRQLPDSCCAHLLVNRIRCQDPFRKSCFDAISDEFLQNISLLVSSFMLFFLFQILLMCFAWHQAKCTRRDYYRFI